MDKERKQRLSLLPSNWDEVTLEKYLVLIATLPEVETNKIESDLLVISALTGIETDDLRLIFFKDLQSYINRIQFIYDEPLKAKIKYTCKGISEIGYDEFIVWMQLQEKAFENTDKLLPIFFPELKDVNVNQLPITTVNACFFLLRKKLRWHLIRSQISLIWKLVLMKILRKGKM